MPCVLWSMGSQRDNGEQGCLVCCGPWGHREIMENRDALCAVVHGVAESQTQLSH